MFQSSHKFHFEKGESKIDCFLIFEADLSTKYSIMIHRLFLTLIILSFTTVVFSQFGSEQTIVFRSTDSTTAVSAADMDGDGDMDPISASKGNSQIAWYENLGNNVFGLARIITNQAIGVSAVYCVDLDGDNDQDVVYSLSEGDMVAWNENSGNGIFGTQQVICDTVDGASDVYCADIDNDGLIDIISSSKNDHKIAWYKNLSNGNFGPQQLISDIANEVIAVMAKDFNQDGLIDVVAVASNENVVGWYRNLGAGAFSARINISTLVDGLVDVSADDINNDGKIDIVSASNNDHKIAWYKNLGNNTFSAQIVITLQVYNITAISVARVNQDIYKDVIVSGSISSDPTIHLKYCKNLYSSFSSSPIMLMPELGLHINSLFPCDIDNDGDQDILFGSDNYEIDMIGWLKNVDGINFPHGRSISDPLQRPTEVCVADLNGDGKQDILSASELGGQIAWYPNLGSNQFGVQTIIAQDIYWWGNIVHAADLDQDGDQDVITGTNNSVLWYENNGIGIFDSTHVITADPLMAPTPSILRDIKTIDLDGDNDLDIISASSDDDRICFFENLGSGLFGSMITLSSTANNVLCLEMIDIDEDGLMDVVVGLYYEVSWYRNLGNNSFGNKLLLGTYEGNFTDVAKADMDGDGDNDILAGGYPRAVWFENNGTMSYWPEHVINSNYFNYYTICSTDLDEDGDQDVFTTGDLGIQTPGPGLHFAFWHENLGAGTFGPAQLIDSNSYGVHLADLDDDSDMDLLLFGNHRIGVLENYLHHTETASGRLYADMNQNAVYDTGDYPIQYINILANPDNAFSHSFSDGTYTISFDETSATYEVFPQTIDHWGITTDSVMYHVTSDTIPSNSNNLDFGYYPIDYTHNIVSDLTGGSPQCNTVINYWLTIRNEGSAPSSGTIQLQLDDSVAYIGSDMTPVSINGQNINWNYSNLNYFQELLIKIQVQMPSFSSIGEELHSIYTVSVDSSGSNLFSLSDTLNQTLLCAYDPNDKTAIPVGEGSNGSIPMETDWIDYTIRFQNTGNDTAVHVIIRDLIDSDLDRTSFDFLASSFPVTITGDENGEMKFAFYNIMLPDSATNELESNGFIRYKLRLKSNLIAGTQIENTANIFFDQNPPIITNTTVHTLIDVAGTQNLQDNTLRIYPNPFSSGIITLTFTNMMNGYSIAMYTLTGTEVYYKENLSGKSHNIYVPGLAKGLYLIKVTNTQNGEFITEKVIAE